MSKKKNPWERLPKESDPAWEAFSLYRDMPYETGISRSLSKLAQRLNKSKTLLANWSRKFNWVERVTAYDSYQDDIEVEERTKSKRQRVEDENQMDTRHIALAVQLQKLIIDYMQTADPEKLTPKGITDLARAASTAANLERVSRHVTHADMQIDLNREMFDYKKERDAGANLEYEDIASVEDEIYGSDDD